MINKLKPGIFVRRRANTKWVLDPFQCHPASFGQIVELTTEDANSRSDNPKLAAYGDATWPEVVVAPFDIRMSPQKKFWIQWSPDECIIIGRIQFLFMGLIWPLLRLLYSKPLEGQPTDYWSLFNQRRADRARAD